MSVTGGCWVIGRAVFVRTCACQKVSEPRLQDCSQKRQMKQSQQDHNRYNVQQRDVYFVQGHSKMTVSCIDCENAAISGESEFTFALHNAFSRKDLPIVQIFQC